MKRSDDGYLAQTNQDVLLPKQLFMDDPQARFLSGFSVSGCQVRHWTKASMGLYST